MKQLLALTTGLLALALFIGCENAKPPSTTTERKVSDGGRKEETKIKTDAGTAGTDADTKARKEAKKQEIKAKIDGISGNIATLEEHAKKLSGDAKKKVEDEIKDLSDKRGDLQKKYDKIDTTEASAWDNFVTELNKSADSVSGASKKAVDDIKK
jgi:hypothetical protein